MLHFRRDVSICWQANERTCFFFFFDMVKGNINGETSVNESPFERKKMRKIHKTLILSAAAAVAFGTVAAGTTYALFTSKSETDVSVVSGKVSVIATSENLVTYSGENLTGDPENDALVPTATVGIFANGGTASINGSTLTVKNMTPGDKVTFDIRVKNQSNVKSMYRSLVSSVEDNGLRNGLIITVNGEELIGSSSKTDYVDLEVGSEDIIVPISVELPSDASDLYQEKTCKIVYAVEAVQGNAFKSVYEVTPENIQSYLDGEKGSIEGCTLLLTEGVYPQLELGRATKYAGSDTEYYIGGISEENKKTYEELVEIKSSSSWSASPYYVRNMNNVTFKAKEGASVKVAGISASAGHIYGTESSPIHDHVLDFDTTSTVKSYYLAQKWNNIAFEGIEFTALCDIASSQEETSIDGVTFKQCSFTTGGIEATNKQGLRFFNNLNNTNLKNLVVAKCSFANCYQGIYTSNIKGIAVSGASFDTTGHNAIAIQTSVAEFSHGNVVIHKNSFANIGDRIVRFAYVGEDTQIVIKGNKATNSGDNDGEVIKANSLAEGITYDIANNDWGTGAKVYNPELTDR